MISESAGGGYAAYGAEDGEGEGTRPEARKKQDGATIDNSRFRDSHTQVRTNPISPDFSL